MTHPDEETLELFVLESDEIADRRGAIEAHLKECAGCMSLLKEMEEYYSDVEAVYQERSKAVSQALTVRSLAVKVPTHTEFGPLSQIRKSWPARVVLFAIRHPFVSTSGMAGLMVGALLLGLQLATVKDRNPSYARAKDEFLVVYNKEGDVLWKKHIGPGYDWEKLSGSTQPDRRLPDEYLVTIDVDGDRKQEVLAVFPYGEMWSMRDAIVCYNSDGTERWVYRVHKRMVFGADTFAVSYRMGFFAVGQFRRNGRAEVIAVANVEEYYPTVVLRLDASNGAELGEYWHSGNFSRMARVDLDGDGTEDLCLVGENNGFDRAVLAVLDPGMISGHSPAPPAYTPRDVPEGREKYFILFPRTDLEPYATHKRNVGSTVTINRDTSIVVGVDELFGTMMYRNIYHFDRSLSCISVDGSDELVIFHRKLEAEGRLKRKLDAAYYEELRRGVQYWDGEKFVDTVTMNKRYLEEKSRLARK